MPTPARPLPRPHHPALHRQRRRALAWGLGCLTILTAHAQDHSADHTAPRPAARMAKAGLAVGAALDDQGKLWLTGLNADGRLFLQTSTDLGQHWSPAQALETGDDQISADGESRPRLVLNRQGDVVISYNRPLAKPYTGEVRLLHSADGGRHFDPPYTLHQDRQIITHRFENLAFDSAGRLHAVWIDKRDGVLAQSRKESFRGASIYHAISSDGGAHFAPEQPLAAHSCECCRIALSPTADGQLAALWRHVFSPNVRDHAFARLPASAEAGATDPETSPQRATEDDWKFDACPHHGPGLAPAADGGFHAVWFGLRKGVAGERYGRLDARGRPVGDVQALPDPAAEHADLVSDGAWLALVWRSFDGEKSHLRAWVSDDDGATFTLRELDQVSGENDHPRLVQGGGRAAVVWRNRNEVRVIALRGPRP